MTKIKICGITNKEDAFWASSLGADFVGLNFYKKSLRKVSLKNAKEIVISLPKYTTAVAVFVDETKEEIIKILKKCGINYVQLHGQETTSFCNELKLTFPGVKIIKVIKIKPGNIQTEEEKTVYLNEIVGLIKQFVLCTDYILFDTYIEEQVGGTGESFNWNTIIEIKKILNEQNVQITFFVAGGLTAENVEEVIELLEPYGVDVSSGVERSPRRKDYDKMKLFIRNAKI